MTFIVDTHLRKCAICKGEDLRVKRVYEEIHRQQDIIRVQIEIPVCGECGERYYDRATMRRLEELRDNQGDQHLPLTEVGEVLLCESLPGS